MFVTDHFLLPMMRSLLYSIIQIGPNLFAKPRNPKLIKTDYYKRLGYTDQKEEINKKGSSVSNSDLYCKGES